MAENFLLTEHVTHSDAKQTASTFRRLLKPDRLAKYRCHIGIEWLATHLYFVTIEYDSADVRSVAYALRTVRVHATV